jgi:hypothetical protein
MINLNDKVHFVIFDFLCDDYLFENNNNPTMTLKSINKYASITLKLGSKSQF